MKLLSEKQSQIVELLKRHSKLSVDDIVEAVGDAKTAVRRQLLLLERRGLLQREYRAAERGRPSLVFTLTADSKQLFPSKEVELLSELMGFLVRDGHEELLERFFDRYWQKRLDQVVKEIKSRGRSDLDTRLEVLKEMLEREGFVPTVRFEKKGRELLLRECHCPIEAAVRTSKLPCQLERRLIAKVLNAPIDSISMRADPSNGCEFRLPVQASKARARRSD
ncbi:MAG: DeoR family transcriptional regulator [Bdellovibrionaceae bacterium]|nr:DeoR family transcriptional regulator [Pseudobdellovibrionaceae bacterium]